MIYKPLGTRPLKRPHTTRVAHSLRLSSTVLSLGLHPGGELVKHGWRGKVLVRGGLGFADRLPDNPVNNINSLLLGTGMWRGRSSRQ